HVADRGRRGGRAAAVAAPGTRARQSAPCVDLVGPARPRRRRGRGTSPGPRGRGSGATATDRSGVRGRRATRGLVGQACWWGTGAFPDRRGGAPARRGRPDAGRGPRALLPVAPADVRDVLGPVHAGRLGGGEAAVRRTGGAAAAARRRNGPV